MSATAVRQVAKQFLCNHSLAELNWTGLFDTFDEDLQRTLAKTTVESNTVLRYPIKLSYQVAFLKYIIKTLEEKCAEIDDILYESLCRLSVQQPSDVYYKHYVVGNTNHVISLRENANFISSGTTGLQTWQAALALAEKIAQNPGQFTEKTVLELGSGMGLLGLVIHKIARPNSLYLSDCHPVVLENLRENIKFNTNSNCDKKNETSSSKLGEFSMFECTNEDSTIEILDLPWEKVSPEFCKNLDKINIVTAADVVYDHSIFEPLLNAMNNLAKYSEVEEFLFSCTVRNKDTLNEFLQLVGENGFMVTQLGIPPQENFVWSAKTDIKLYSIKSNYS